MRIGGRSHRDAPLHGLFVVRPDVTGETERGRLGGLIVPTDGSPPRSRGHLASKSFTVTREVPSGGGHGGHTSVPREK